jgi:tetratricopeptide (TPR) repeat protein
MRAVRFEVFRQTPERVLLRFYGDDGKLAGTRELEPNEVELFAAEVENGYSAALADHAGLGRRLYAWLDGPTERWLASARQGVPGLAVHVDGEEKLRHLPWELMANDGMFLCGQEAAPLTPVRRSGRVKRDLAVQNRPLRLLFLAASPENVQPVLSFEEEERRILEATRKQSIELEVEESGSLVALDLLNESLEIEDATGNVKGKAPTLHEMARVIAQQGDIAKAFELWDQSLQIYGAIGDVQGIAATLHEMAGVLAVRGEIPDALELWNRSLQITEAIGEIKGKAATLANMAWVSGQQGDAAGERRLNLQAAAALASVRAWLDLVTVLRNLGSSDDPNAPAFLAQADWLTLRVQVPSEVTGSLAFALCEKLGFEAEAAPRVAAAAVVLSQLRGEGHPEREQNQQAAVGLLGQCAAARQISSDDVPAWIEAEGLNDRERLFPALTRDLEALVGDSWLFDRSLVNVAGTG